MPSDSDDGRVTARAPRKDVVRNRQKLLEAARAVFAEQGLGATLDDVARRAGVGAGTAYRHFGNRQLLVAAIFSDVTATFIADAESSLAVEDPWAGFTQFVEAFTRRQARDRGLHQVFAGDHESLLDPEDWAALTHAISRVVQRAQDAGAVRDDLEVDDLVALFVAMGPLYDLSSAASKPLWRRHLEIFLSGVRKGVPGPWCDGPAALGGPGRPGCDRPPLSSAGK